MIKDVHNASLPYLVHIFKMSFFFLLHKLELSLVDCNLKTNIKKKAYHKLTALLHIMQLLFHFCC